MPILFYQFHNLNLRPADRDGVPPARPFLPLSGTAPLTITGVSRDNAGAPLAGCTCTLFRVSTAGPVPVFTQVATTVSDGSGNYSFVVGADGPWRVIWDLDGTPVRAGISLKSLSGI